MRTFASSVYGSNSTGWNIQFYPAELLKIKYMSNTGLSVTSPVLTAANVNSFLLTALRKITSLPGEASNTDIWDFEVGVDQAGNVSFLSFPPVVVNNWLLSAGRYFPMVKVDGSGAEITQGVKIYGF